MRFACGLPVENLMRQSPVARQAGEFSLRQTGPQLCGAAEKTERLIPILCDLPAFRRFDGQVVNDFRP
jgi:hypothetical protein